MAKNQLIVAMESSDLTEKLMLTTDLMKLARLFLSHTSTPVLNCFNEDFANKFTIIVDSECCLDRLYGGFFSDWTCGGQWNKTYQFLAMLMAQAEKANIRFIVSFSAQCCKDRFQDWIDEQIEYRNRGNKVFNLINARGIPPPKVWWLAPSCLRTVLRLCFRSLHIPMICTLDDHQLELSHYVHDLKLNGLMSDTSEFLLFSLPHYFSAKSLKLTFKGSLECKEYMYTTLFSNLKLTKDKVCILSALLGNHILRRDQLDDIYANHINQLLPKEEESEQDNKDDTKSTLDLIKALADFVRNLESPIINMDGLMMQIFESSSDSRIPYLERSILYYLRGTKEFSSYANSRLSSKSSDIKSTENIQLFNAKNTSTQVNGYSSDNESSSNKQLETAVSNSSDYESVLSSTKLSSNHTETTSNSSILSTLRKRYEDFLLNYKQPELHRDVLKTVTERCKRGLMSPMIYSILINGEVRLPYVLEEECHFEFPPIHTIYKPARQMIYAILFNLNHQKYMEQKNNVKNEQSDILIKEWIWSINNQYDYPEITKAVPLDWGVPTLKRLWFGVEVDDKNRRMRSFLTVMKSEESLLLNTFYVPPNLLIMAVVLRYLLTLDSPILRKCELDAILVHCFSRDLTNWEFIQELKLPKIVSRSVQLASVLMQGVETALMANDACGSPIPWNLCAPWLFFDGKLLHYMLSKASDQTTLPNLCNNDMDMVLKVERMRKAICNGISVNFSSNQFLNHSNYGNAVNPGVVAPNHLPPIKLPSNRTPNRNTFSRGGQLQIAGVVVGSWGPNYNFSHSNRYHASMYSNDGGYYSRSNRKNYQKLQQFQPVTTTKPPNILETVNDKSKKKSQKSINDTNVGGSNKIATTTVTTVTVTNQISTEIINKKTEPKKVAETFNSRNNVNEENTSNSCDVKDKPNIVDNNNCTLFKSQQPPIILKPIRNQNAPSDRHFNANFRKEACSNTSN